MGSSGTKTIVVKQNNTSPSNSNNNINNDDYNIKNNTDNKSIILNNSNINNNNDYSITNNNIIAERFVFEESDGTNFVVHRNDGMNDFIIEITLSKIDERIIHNKAKFIMILDTSGSMSSYVQNLVTKIIPRGLNLLNYRDTDFIHLITFQSKVKYDYITVGQLKKDLSIVGGGATYMADVYKNIKFILNSYPKQKNYRILVLSDGIIYDQEKTKNEAEIIKEFIDVSDFYISSGAIRYNSNESDTKAISSILMLNTDISKTRVLTNVSISQSNEEVSQKIYELFKDDYFATDYILKSDKIKFRIEPWKEGKNEIKLNEGKNVIFADKNPSIEHVGIYEEGKLKYTKDDFKNGYKINYLNYNALLGVKINMTARKVRINKTSGSIAALEENKKIINYFENFEKRLPGNNELEDKITKELKRANELDISKFNNEELAQYIGVENNMIPIEDFLKIGKIGEKEEKNINEIFQNVWCDALKIDSAFEKVFSNKKIKK